MYKYIDVKLYISTHTQTHTHTHTPLHTHKHACACSESEMAVVLGSSRDFRDHKNINVSNNSSETLFSERSNPGLGETFFPLERLPATH